jgi:MYXO-CTERM domain-containing protein
MAAVAVHVVDDNFLQPQPGTSADEHLASGLVPLGFLAAVATAYARLRPGLQASGALLAGFFGVLVGTEAAYYTQAVGPSGDDYTGLLSIAAGLLLLGLGGVTLWRSRRRDDAVWWRYGRRLLLAAGVALTVVALLIPIAIAYVVTHTLRSEVPKAELGARYNDVAKRCDGDCLPGPFRAAETSADVDPAWLRRLALRPSRRRCERR